ncbi:hypothetical protein D3C81_114380 [compost metagenome]
MNNNASLKKFKKLRIGFFTSSTGTKTKTSNAQGAFENLYNRCASLINNAHTAELHDKKLKIVFHEKDVDAKFYFGYVSCSRDGFHLPYIGDENWNEHNIPLDDKKYIVERTYFLYYYESDILLLSLNHLGPKERDLSYLLFSTYDLSKPISFEAIWKKESIKQLLETGSTLRSCEVTMAAPRNFNATNYDLTNSFSKNLVEMMVGMGGTHLKLNLRGRASGRKSIKGYLSDEVKEGLKELLEKVPAIMRKAEVTQPKDTKSKSLLDQVLISAKSVSTIDGYSNPTEVRLALVSAKIDHLDYLKEYDISKNQ